MKKYTAKSCISISVPMKNGNNIHVSFQAVTGGGSIFYTDDEEVATALECHHKYGKLFKRDTAFDAQAAKVNADQASDDEAVSPEGQDEDSTSTTQIKVACMDDAKEYLCEKFGVSRTKLKTKKAITETAAAHGIEFLGI